MSVKKSLKEINQEIKKSLLKERSATATYKKYLSGLFKQYRELVASLSKDSIEKDLPLDFKLESAKKEILKSTNSLIRSYNAYSEGKVGTAIALIRNRFVDKDTKNLFLKVLVLNSKGNWYRARKLSKGSRKFEPKDMFHIPFDKRTEVVNYRYSITGYPCLYLGKTILSCWVEMGMPGLDELAVSRIKVKEKQSIKVVDLCCPSENESALWDDMTDEQRRTENYHLLMTWPLIIACSIKTITPDAPFKQEYVHPQLLMQALIDSKSGIWGVAYTSTHRGDSDISDREDDYCNVAIPVRKVKDKGQCSELKQKIQLTKGVTFLGMDIENVFNSTKEDGETYHFGHKNKFDQAEDYMLGIKLEDLS